MKNFLSEAETSIQVTQEKEIGKNQGKLTGTQTSYSEINYVCTKQNLKQCYLEILWILRLNNL